MPLSFRSSVLFSVLIALAAGFCRAEGAPPVHLVEDEARIVVENGLVAFTLDKALGGLSSIRARVDGQERELGNGAKAMIYDFDNHEKGHLNFGQRDSVVQVAGATEEAAEVVVRCEPNETCRFAVELHWILRRGDRGFYTYANYRHGRGMPAAVWEQTRAVIRAARGTEVFTHYVPDGRRQRAFPTGRVLDTVFDTTWRYDDGHGDSFVQSKYEYASFIGDDLVHGLAGPGVGLWLIAPSRDYVNGGPLRQELTVHQDSPARPPQNNILLWMLQGNHFGGPNMEIAADEEWTRFYGPAMVYINEAPTVAALWADASEKARSEEAKWPYAFIRHPDYPLERGTVSGRLALTDGGGTEGAWVVLAPPDAQDWCMSARGYLAWTRAGADGRFEMTKVRPGRYTLFATGGDQFADFRRENITVHAGANALGTLDWHPVTHGRTLWQIGRPDRSTQEFANGQDYRHFTNHLRYAENFPHDVTFTIGQSREDRDWNFSQWGWYRERPWWAVRFKEPRAGKGTGTLTLAFAAFDYPRGLRVRLNGREIGTVNLKKSGMAAYRCGGQDSLRQTVTLEFDAALIGARMNELQLEPAGAVPFSPENDSGPAQLGAVMYDALRLEVDEGRPFGPATPVSAPREPSRPQAGRWR